MKDGRDVRILRELARRYVDICSEDVQQERRDLWRRHNSLVRTRPLIYMRYFSVRNEEIPDLALECEDPFYRRHEDFLRRAIFQGAIGDDFVFEPWITQRATTVTPAGGPWGFRYDHIYSDEPRGAWKFDPPLKELADIEKLAEPNHVIDEEATARNLARLHEAVGDLLEVNVDRAPFYRVWRADISCDLAQLRGLEQVMWDMADNPDWLHGLAGRLSAGVLRTHDEAERAGDWRLCNHENQAMPYALELPDPQANGESVTRDRLWTFVAAQEMAQVSPQMHEEFVLDYQLPIMEKFGLVAYGCCEDLTHKIDMLRRIPNLRRIAVTPVADVARCAEQIGEDYVFSWRPNPALMVSCGFDEERVRRIIREGLQAARGCHVDITLKDIETVQGDPTRLRRWVEVVREVIEESA